MIPEVNIIDRKASLASVHKAGRLEGNLSPQQGSKGVESPKKMFLVPRSIQIGLK